MQMHKMHAWAVVQEAAALSLPHADMDAHEKQGLTT
jgi:hypothetical protein